MMIRSSHSVAFSQSFALVLSAGSFLFFGCDGCEVEGPGATSATTGDPDPFLFRGLAVDCLPATSSDPLVCMSFDTWMCSEYDFYKREALCAQLLGGPPSDYNNRPALKMVKMPGADEFTDNVDCARLDDIEDMNGDPVNIINGVGWHKEDCNLCRLCEMQIAGRQAWENQHDSEEPGWDDMLFCPATSQGVPWNDPQLPDGGGCNWNNSMDPTEGDPTGGDPTGGDPTGGDPTGGTEQSGIWLCNGSGMLCENFTDPNNPSYEHEGCMSYNNPLCVEATSEATAIELCKEVCECKNNKYSEDATSYGLDWLTPLNCDYFDTSMPPPVYTTDPTLCDGGGAMSGQCNSDGLTGSDPFSATGELSLPGGGTASMEELDGHITFAFGSCSGLCPLTVEDFRATTSVVFGEYSYVDPVTGPESLGFTISGLSVQTLQPLNGLLDPTSGMVTFTGESLFALVSAGPTKLDGVSLNGGFNNLLFALDEIQGHWSGSELTLDLEWEAPTLGLHLWIEITSG